MNLKIPGTILPLCSAFLSTFRYLNFLNVKKMLLPTCSHFNIGLKVVQQDFLVKLTYMYLLGDIEEVSL